MNRKFQIFSQRGSLNGYNNFSERIISIDEMIASDDAFWTLYGTYDELFGGSCGGFGIDNLLPVAKVILLDLDFVIGIGGGTSPFGIAIMLQGPDAGKCKFVACASTGIGVDVSASIQETNIFYSGSIDNVNMNMLNGLSFLLTLQYQIL